MEEKEDTVFGFDIGTTKVTKYRNSSFVALEKEP